MSIMPASEKQRSFDDSLFREAIFSEKQGSLEEQLAESMMVGVQAKEGHLQLPRCRSVEVFLESIPATHRGARDTGEDPQRDE